LEDSVTPKDDKPNFESLKRMFAEAADRTNIARLQSMVDRDYFDGPGQWTSAERAALKARRQPDNYFNRVRPAIEGVIGVIEQGQTDPRCWPRNPQDEDAAEVVTKVLRYIEDKADFDQVKVEAALQYFIEGSCAVVVELDENRDVTVVPVPFAEFFYDPFSRAKDFSDARFLGIAKWRWADDIIAEFPKAKADVEGVLDGATMVLDTTFEDKPSDVSPTFQWVDKAKRRVMQVEMYHREGQEWRRCVFHSGGLLDYGPSPWLDNYGKTRCPIIAASCYIDRENNRYGKVRDMRGPQDEINKRRSKLLHLVSVSQIQAVDPSAVEVDADVARKEAARPDGVIPFGWQKVQTTDIAAGQANLLTEAKAEIERMGPNPAILGRQSESSSGRAQLVRQQAGMTELAPVLGVFDRWVLRVYRAMWFTARQWWQAPMFLRVTEDDKAPEFLGLNQPPQGATPVPGGDGQQLMLDPRTQQPSPEGKPVFQMPDGSFVLGYENAVAEMDVDITIETTPDTANVAQEQFLALVELAKAGVQIPPQILIEASALPKKREIVEKMQALGQEPNPAAEIEQAEKMADIEKTRSETELNKAKTVTMIGEAQVNAAVQLQRTQMDAQRQDTDATFRAAEMDQRDSHFAGQLDQKDRLAAQSPPPGL
jgi:hypothetical protein